MSVLGDIVSAIETRMTALGFDLSTEVFDFAAVPDSVAHKAYRITTRQISAEYQAGGQVEGLEAIEIYVLYRNYRADRTTRGTVFTDREAIEADLVNNATLLALSSDPILSLDDEATCAREESGYVVSKLVFRCDYLRTV